MPEKTPVVSIIMATFNRAHLILETIESIKNQTFKDFECLIIDDGSEDNTENLIREIARSDSRFIYYKRPKEYLKGLPGCRNYGLDICRGEFIIFFDDDDLVHPKNLEVNTSILLGSEFDFVHYQKQPFLQEKVQYTNDPVNTKSEINKWNLGDILDNKISMASCTVMWKKFCFAEDRFMEDLSYAEEWELYSRLISMGFQGISLSNVFYYNRKHPESNTGRYFSGDIDKRFAMSKAIIAVFHNLQKNDLLNRELMRFLINKSYQFKEFSTFENILSKYSAGLGQKLFWRLYFLIMPMRVIFYKFRKSFNFI